MIGPERLGFWSGGALREHGVLRAGKLYRVVRPFTDFDGHVHAVGEQWAFLGAALVPYHDGLSLFVSPDGLNEWHIRMRWANDAQGRVIDAFGEYVEKIS